MIEIRITYSDSMTGEEEGFDTTVSEINAAEITRVVTEHAGGGEYKCLFLHMDRWNSTWAFVLENNDEGAYSGFLVTGIIYTSFLK